MNCTGVTTPLRPGRPVSLVLRMALLVAAVVTCTVITFVVQYGYGLALAVAISAVIVWIRPRSGVATGVPTNHRRAWWAAFFLAAVGGTLASASPALGQDFVVLLLSIAAVAMVAAIATVERETLSVLVIVMLAVTIVGVQAFRYPVMGSDTLFHDLTTSALITGYATPERLAGYADYPAFYHLAAPLGLITGLAGSVDAVLGITRFVSIALIAPFALLSYNLLRSVFDRQVAVWGLLAISISKAFVHWFSNSVAMTGAVVLLALVLNLVLTGRPGAPQLVRALLLPFATIALVLMHPFISLGLVILAALLLALALGYRRSQVSTAVLLIALVLGSWMYLGGTLDFAATRAARVLNETLSAQAEALALEAIELARSPLQFEFDHAGQHLLLTLVIVGLLLSFRSLRSSWRVAFVALLATVFIGMGYLLQLVSPALLAHRWWLVALIGVGAFAGVSLATYPWLRWLYPLSLSLTLVSSDIAGPTAPAFAEHAFQRNLTAEQATAMRSIQGLRSSRLLVADNGLYPYFRYAAYPAYASTTSPDRWVSPTRASARGALIITREREGGTVEGFGDWPFSDGSYTDTLSEVYVSGSAKARLAEESSTRP